MSAGLLRLSLGSTSLKEGSEPDKDAIRTGSNVTKEEDGIGESSEEDEEESSYESKEDEEGEEDESSSEEDSSSSSEDKNDDDDDDDDDSSSSSSSDEYDSDDELVRTKVIFDDDEEIRIRQIPTDSTYADLRRKLKKEYKIGDFKLYYYDHEGDKISIQSKRDLRLALREEFKMQDEDDDDEGGGREEGEGDNSNAGPKSSHWRLYIASSPLQRPGTSSMSTLPLHTPKNSERLVWQQGTLIGRGAFGKVYKAFAHNFGSEFAVKCVNLHSGGGTKKKNSKILKSLQNEIEFLRKLEHPNIVSYLGTEQRKKQLFVFMQYCAGGSVAAAIKKWGALCEAVVRRYTLQILDGLTFLHSRQIAHRDIKPSNLLLHDGIVKLADFGTARFTETATQENLQVKKESFTAGHVGTCIYMAPEVMSSGSKHEELSLVDETGTRADKLQLKFDILKTDIWSLGASVVEMASGEPAFASQAKAVYSVCIQEKGPNIPECLSDEGKDFLKSCFKHDFVHRPDSVSLREHPFCDSVTSNPDFLRTSATTPNLLAEMSEDFTTIHTDLDLSNSLEEEHSKEVKMGGLEGLEGEESSEVVEELLEISSSDFKTLSSFKSDGYTGGW